MGMGMGMSSSLAPLGPLGLDRLPETLLGVLTAGVSVSVAGGRRVLAPLDPFSEPVLGYKPRVVPSSSAALGEGGAASGASASPSAVGGGAEGGGASTRLLTRRQREELAAVERVRDEMDAILAASCPLCEGSLADLAKPFLGGAGGAAGGSGTLAAREAREEEEWAL